MTCHHPEITAEYEGPHLTAACSTCAEVVRPPCADEHPKDVCAPCANCDNPCFSPVESGLCCECMGQRISGPRVTPCEHCENRMEAAYVHAHGYDE